MNKIKYLFLKIRISHDITECIHGYTGTECSITCPYPLFGKDCQSVCNCSIPECDFVSGCHNGMYTFTVWKKPLRVSLDVLFSIRTCAST